MVTELEKHGKRLSALWGQRTSLTHLCFLGPDIMPEKNQAFGSVFWGIEWMSSGEKIKAWLLTIVDPATGCALDVSSCSVKHAATQRMLCPGIRTCISMGGHITFFLYYRRFYMRSRVWESSRRIDTPCDECSALKGNKHWTRGPEFWCLFHPELRLCKFLQPGGREDDGHDYVHLSCDNQLGECVREGPENTGPRSEVVLIILAH